jgi:hypothetical protein
MVWFVLVGEAWSAGVAIEVSVCTGVDAVLASVCEDALLEFVVQPATRIPATRMLAAISIKILFFFIGEASPENILVHTMRTGWIFSRSLRPGINHAWF